MLRGSSPCKTEAGAPIPLVTEKFAVPKDNLGSSASLKINISSLSPFTTTCSSCGGLLSGFFPNHEFCLPGVPPEGSAEAIQFRESLAEPSRSTNSSDQPPC